jgi:magnesium transporter
MLMALLHSDATGWTKVADFATVSDLRAEPGTLVWGEADMAELGSDEVASIAEEFDLDALAVEDAVKPRQRPKLETYPTHRFAVLHDLHEVEDQLEKRQISCFVGDDFVVVIHEGEHEILDAVRSRLHSTPTIADGPAYLFYVLIDTVVDEYGRHADRLEDAIEHIEDEVVTTARSRARGTKAARLRRREGERVQLRIYSVKQQIARMRRYGIPLERVLETLLHQLGDDDGPEAATRRRLFRDVHDHTLRVADQVRNVDALADAMLDLLRAQLSEDLSETNRKLTAWAAIFAAPTVIASVYGMNYELFPANATSNGFWFAVGLMLVTATGLYVSFKSRNWL